MLKLLYSFAFLLGLIINVNAYCNEKSVVASDPILTRLVGEIKWCTATESSIDSSFFAEYTEDFPHEYIYFGRFVFDFGDDCKVRIRRASKLLAKNNDNSNSENCSPIVYTYCGRRPLLAFIRLWSQVSPRRFVHSDFAREFSQFLQQCPYDPFKAESYIH